MKNTPVCDMPEMTPVLNPGQCHPKFWDAYQRFMMRKPLSIPDIEQRMGRPQDFTFMGSVRYFNWEVPFKDSRYWIVVSSRGTDIEVPPDCTAEQAVEIVLHATEQLSIGEDG